MRSLRREWICRMSVAVAALAGSRVAAQQFEWHSYTSMTSVNTVAMDSRGGYWAATAGGAFRVDPASDVYDVYRNINALSTISLTALAVDPVSGVVAFGGSRGELDLLTPGGLWKHSLDIKLTQQRRTVHRLMFADSLLYIAADYGISTYDVRRFAFIATCTHLGAIPSGRSALTLAVWRDSLYVGTETGLAYTPLATPNIADSAFWKVMPGAVSSKTVFALGATSAYLYVGTANGLLAWTGDTLLAVAGLYGAGQTTTAITTSGDTVYAAQGGAIYRVTGLTSAQISAPAFTLINSLAYDAAADAVLIGDGVAGLTSVHNGASRALAPNSPAGNIFSSITFDRNNVMWATGALKNGTGSGVYRFDGRTWQSFNATSHPPLLWLDAHASSADSLGNVWVGTFGQGLLRFYDSAGSVTWKHYDRFNSPFSATTAGTDSGFIMVTGSVAGANDIEWIVPFDNMKGAIHPHLVAYNPHVNGGTFYPFVCPNTDFRLNFDIVIDGSGTKWIAPAPNDRVDIGTPAGLLYFNEGRTLDSTSDDVFDVLSTATRVSGEALRTNVVTTVALDNYGELWVGTADGIDIIANPEAVLTNTQDLRIRKPSLSALNGPNANITCILSDQQNNKWVGTLASGLTVVSADGTAQLAHFDMTNSPILDDKIIALSIDKRTGIVYIGTVNGMSAVRATGLVQSVSGELRVGPQPYFVPSSAPMYIYGVPIDAEVKIFTVSGALVRGYGAGELTQLGGVGGWDGKDKRGNWAASGVYFVTYVQPDGTSQVKKFAVIRH